MLPSWTAPVFNLEEVTALVSIVQVFPELETVMSPLSPLGITIPTSEIPVILPLESTTIWETCSESP